MKPKLSIVRIIVYDSLLNRTSSQFHTFLKFTCTFLCVLQFILFHLRVLSIHTFKHPRKVIVGLSLTVIWLIITTKRDLSFLFIYNNF